MKTIRIIFGVILTLLPAAALMAAPRVILHRPPLGDYGVENLWNATIVNSGGDTGAVYFEG